MTKTALIVIDMQAGLFYGQLAPTIYKAEALLSATRRLIDAARSAKCTVIFTHYCAPDGGVLVKGTANWEIHPKLTPERSDLVVLKQGSSAFDGTDLAGILRQRNIDTVVICGLQSEFCVASTCLSALEHGFDVIIAQDCHSTVLTNEFVAEMIVEQQNDILKQRGVAVLTLAELTKTVFHESA